MKWSMTIQFQLSPLAKIYCYNNNTNNSTPSLEGLLSTVHIIIIITTID